MTTIRTTNPATGEPLGEYEEHSAAEVDRALAAVDAAWRAWRRASLEQRAEPLRRAGELLRERAGDLARLMALEMGKPLAQGRGEAEKCAWVCDHYAEHAARYLADEPAQTDAARSYVAYRPLGIVLAVMPWNFPLWQVFRFAAPALMAGNAGLLKHASNVTGCALEIERLLRDAGFPEDLFRTLVIGSSRVAGVLEDRRVVAATLTGSTRAGRAVAEKAGSLLKKTVLELGGSDPYVVLADADLELAAATCAKSRLINSGQSCIAAKRFVVVESVRAEFEERFVAAMRAATVGDPLADGVEVGPQARADLRDELHEQVRKSVAAGARLLLGGEVEDGPGAFYPPTVLTGVVPGMPAHDEELFGPAAAIVPVPDEAAAIRAANDSSFGLGAAVFTRDAARGERLARDELEAGSCFVNAHVQSDPRLPFGGVKESGYGRELAAHGIREFVNAKTIYVG